MTNSMEAKNAGSLPIKKNSGRVESRFIVFTITRVSSRDEGHARISRSLLTVFGVQSYRNIIM